MNHLSNQQVFEFLDNEISVVEHKKIQLHLDECADCRAELSTHQAMSNAVRRVTIEPLNPQFTAELMRLLINEPTVEPLLVPAQRRREIVGIPIKRIAIFIAFAAVLALLVNLPHTPETRAPNPIFQNISAAYSDWIQLVTHTIVEFFATLSAIIPIKSISSFGLFILAAVILWLADRAFQKRFRIGR